MRESEERLLQNSEQAERKKKTNDLNEKEKMILSSK